MKVRFGFVVCLLGLVYGYGSPAQPSRSPAITKQTQRILVKVRAPLAQEIEAELPWQELALAPGQAKNDHVQGFMSRHSAQKLAPLYSNLVRMKKQAGLSDLELAALTRRRFSSRASRNRAGGTPPEISRTYVLELQGSSPEDMRQAVERLNADSDVEFAEPDQVISVNQIPNDPYLSSSGTWGQNYPDLWGLFKINAPTAWNTSTGSGIIVAVVDTGIDYNHPDIAANIWINTKEIPNNGIDDDGNGFIDDVRGWDFIGSNYLQPTQSNDPIDRFGHGTHVAGTIAAVGNNGIGVAGVAWQAQVMAVKGLDDQGFGLDSTLSNAIIYAANNGADVISNSWSGQGTSQVIADAVSYAYNLGAVVVAAAGNDSDDARNYFPGNLEQAITVAATDHFDSFASFSNSGTKIDVAAPGVDILSLRAAGTTLGTPVDSNYTRASGTSMATPHVSGAAALILAQHPDYSNESVRQALRVSGADLGSAGFDPFFGYGRIDAGAALALSDVVAAKISTPVDETHLNGATTISGVAQGASFDHYTLEYGAGQTPSTWVLFQTSTTQVSNGVLGVFDPGKLTDGLYTIRLTAYDTAGHAFVDRAELVVDYIVITNPPPPVVPVTALVFKPGSIISISGTATGATFQDFRIEWTSGISPIVGWTSSGITLAGGGLSPVTNGPLGTWDTSSITQAGYYTIRVSVDNTGFFTNRGATLVYLEPDLLSANWPIALAQAPSLGSGIVPAADAAGNIRLTFVNPTYLGSTAPAKFWDVSPDGSRLNTVTLNSGDYFQPAAGNLDGNPGEESATADGTFLDVFRSDDTFYNLSPASPLDLRYSQIVVDDLHSDSQLDTFIVGDNRSALTSPLYAWRSDGQQVSGNFPITLQGQNANLSTVSMGPRVLVGDVDGDGNKEIVAEEGSSSSTFTLRLFANDGTPRLWGVPVLNGYPHQMALADLDHNGQLEVLLLCMCNSQETLYVFQPDGSIRTGWPQILGTASGSYMAVGDLNRDGKEEIVVSNYNRIYVFEPDGTQFSNAWPLVGGFSQVFGPIALADINGDGLPEILIVRDQVLIISPPFLASTTAESPEVADGAVIQTIGQQLPIDSEPGAPPQARVDITAQIASALNYHAPQLLALHSDGSVVKSWNLQGANGNQPFYVGVLTVGDFNGDGITDIALVYQTVLGGGVDGALQEGVATVFSTGAPFKPSANDWPMIYQNTRNNAVLKRPAVLTVTPTTLNFPGEPTGVAAPSQSVSITNTSLYTASNFSVQVLTDGSAVLIAPPDFSEQDNCGTSVAPGATCVVNVFFTPTQPGSRTGRVNFAFAGSLAAPVPTVSLSGTGLAPQITPSATSLTFAPQLINTTSQAQVLTLTNTGNVSATLTGFSVNGDFAQTNTCGTPLAPGNSCTVSITFTPTVRGGALGGLQANFGPITFVSLTGTGQAILAAATPGSLSFAPTPLNTTSTAQTITFTNTGDLPATVSGVSISGDYAQTNTCGASLAVGASCSVSVTFTPTARGSRTGTVALLGNFTSTPPVVNLSGTGQAFIASLTPASFDFGSVPVNTSSSSQAFSYSNTGDLPLTVSSVSVAADFSQSNTCPATLAVNTSCSINVTFAPRSTGAQTATLAVSGSAAAGASLTGTGVMPLATISPASLSFGNQRVGTSSAPQVVTVTNSGAYSFFVNDVSYPQAYTITSNCFTLIAPGASCTVNVVFAPTSLQTAAGVLTIAGDFTATPSSVSLSGTPIASTATLSPASLTFAGQVVGTVSPTQTLTLSNTGNAPNNLTAIQATGDFAQSNNCGATLAVGATCTISVSFAPTAHGSRSGSITVSGDFTSTAPSASLTGTGTTPVAAWSPASLSFANQLVGNASNAQVVTLTNTGDGPLTISGITASGDFAQTNSCGATLAAGANCTINVTFVPTTTGTRTGSLSLNSNSSVAVSSITLAGTGVAPAAVLSPASLSFGNQLVNTSTIGQGATLSNPGTAPLVISSIAVTGDFTQTNTCGSTLTAGSSCVISIVFTPAARGSRSGVLTVNSNASGTPPTTALSGTGIAPVASVSPSSLAFPAQLIFTASSQQSVTLTNSGDSTLNISSVTVTGDFSQTNNCFAVAPGASCTINVTFNPSASGTCSGTLTITDDSITGST